MLTLCLIKLDRDKLLLQLGSPTLIQKWKVQNNEKGTNVHVKIFSNCFFKLRIVGKMGCFKHSIQILVAKVIKIYDQIVLQLLSK